MHEGMLYFNCLQISSLLIQWPFNNFFHLQNYFARNFYNMRMLALFVAFAINFILLFYTQTEQHSGCGAASPSQGHRDPDSLRAALSLGGEAPAWECSLLKH